MADKGNKSSMETFAPNDKADYYSRITSITVNRKNAYELKGKFLDDLHNNDFSGTNGKDTVEHIEYYLKLINPIKLPNVDHDKLRVVVFLISLVGEPELEFRSSRRHFKTLSLDELRSPDFNSFSDQEYSEEEVAKTMAETMEQYMSKTRADYGLGILDSRGAIPSKTVVDAKVAIQKMVEYSQKWHNGTSRSRSTKTSDGLAAIQVQLNNLGREIKKVNEKVYVAEVGCEQCKGTYYTKDCPLTEEGKTLKETV
ncbi:hypothetical protein Tco_0437856 [Tanacetum coccineum]